MTRRTLHDELMEAAGLAPAAAARWRSLHAGFVRSSLTLRFVLFASLLVALTFVPWIRSHGFGWVDVVLAIVLAAAGLVVRELRRMPPKEDVR